MTLVASKDAIGEVTDLLRTRLSTQAMVNVEIGRPEAAALGDGGPKFNLFLFQVDFDPSLKNYPLDEGQVAPLWFVLRYLLTAFDVQKDSDSVIAHKLLGQGMAALQELNFMQSSAASLLGNPEPLKISFDAADVELLSKVMQGSDEKYRVSCAFQVRPVMIMPQVQSSYAPAVKSVGPPQAPGAAAVPSMGPRLNSLSPERFEAGATLSLSGDDIDSSIDQVWVGAASFPVIAARGGQVKATIDIGTGLSAGNYPITVARTLPSGRSLTSNALIGSLMPTITGVSVGALTPNAGKLFGDVSFTGRRLGGPDDTILVAFYRDGAVALLLEATGSAAQTNLTAQVTAQQALAPGTYYLILRVNGAQAADSMQVNWS